MESEKVKEIKKVLEEGQFNTINHHQKEGKPIKISFADILTLINELESENEELSEKYINLIGKFNKETRKVYKFEKENQQLKDRIAELEKENVIRQKLIDDFSKENERLYNDIHKKELPLKEFAERLKEKSQKSFINVGGLTASAKSVTLHDIDETLKEFIKGE